MSTWPRPDEHISSGPYPSSTSRPATEYVRSPAPTSTTTATWSPNWISNCSPDGAIAMSLPGLRVDRSWARPPARDGERPDPHRDSHERCPRVQGRELGTRVEKRPDTQPRDPVPDLVEGDHASGHSSELLLAEADREWKERRAAETGEAKGEDAESRLVLGEQPDEDEGSGEHE